MADERLQEVDICGRQGLGPHGHRLHMLLDRFSFLNDVLLGVVEDRLGRASPHIAIHALG